MKKEDQVYALKLAEMARRHSSEAFYALDDPLEAAVFSVLLELMKGLSEEDNDKLPGSPHLMADRRYPVVSEQGHDCDNEKDCQN